MGRLLDHRYVLEGELLALKPISVGSSAGDAARDLRVARNGDDVVHIPGTSLAGTLRSMLGDYIRKPERLLAVWGSELDDGSAGLVCVRDAAVIESTREEFRDGVGIDRFEGRACDRIKFDREIVPKGARFALHIEIDVPAGASDELKVDLATTAAALRDILVSGRLRMGGATSRGFGRVKWTNPEIRRIDLGTRDGLLGYLASRASNGHVGQPCDLPSVNCIPGAIEVNIQWRHLSPLLVAASEPFGKINTAPLLSIVEAPSTLAQVIPGSSIKGVIRSLAERIVATLADDPVPDNTPGSERFIAMMGQKANPLVASLFGIPRPRSGAAYPGLNFGRGALSIDDCFAEEGHVDMSKWRAAWGKSVDDVAALKRLEEIGWKGAYPATHTAIERILGHAATHKLYIIMEPPPFRFEEFNLWIDIPRLKATSGTVDPTAVLGLLLVTLREFTSENVTVGYGGSKGFGAISVEKIGFKVHGDGEYDAIKALDGLCIDQAEMMNPSEELTTRLEPFADAWAKTAKALESKGIAA